MVVVMLEEHWAGDEERVRALQNPWAGDEERVGAFQHLWAADEEQVGAFQHSRVADEEQVGASQHPVVDPAVVEDRYYIMRVVPRGFLNLYYYYCPLGLERLHQSTYSRVYSYFNFDSVLTGFYL
jgi:hypothetical protein